MKTPTSIYVIGPGRLGGQIAWQALQLGVTKVYLSGRDEEKTAGMAVDLQECFLSAEVIPLRGYALPEPVDYTFFTFSTLSWKKSIHVNDRLIDGKSNLKIIDTLLAQVNPLWLGYVCVVSNPVDVLTLYCQDKLPSKHVMGFGISLDERRFTRTLSQLGLIQPAERLFCIGEHGKACVPVLSQLRESTLTADTYEKVKAMTFQRTQNIITKFSIPFYSPQWLLAELLQVLIGKEEAIISISIPLEREIYGVQHSALGLPLQFMDGKPIGIYDLPISDYEAMLFREASHVVRDQLRQLLK